MTRFLQSLCGILLSLAIVTLANADEPLLVIGSAAPKLEVKKFVKGEPVKQFEKNKIYVVEFWATWCGPCIKNIPHLTELQKQYKDVVFIGVDVWEDDTSSVAPFVKEMGEKMNYRVALDLVPDKANPDEGKMALNWLKAANEDGIPTAFVVNGDGVIAWIGNPGEIDKPLDKIVAGKWDVAAAAKHAMHKRKIVAKLEHPKDETPESIVKFLDDQFAAAPELEDEFWLYKLEYALKNAKAPATAADYADKLIDKVGANDWETSATVAEYILEFGKDAKLVEIAVKAAEKADALSKRSDTMSKRESRFIANLLARAYFAKGDAAKAVVEQQRALKQAKADDEPDKEQIKEWEGLLKQYEQEAKKK